MGAGRPESHVCGPAHPFRTLDGGAERGLPSLRWRGQGRIPTGPTACPRAPPVQAQAKGPPGDTRSAHPALPGAPSKGVGAVEALPGPGGRAPLAAHRLWDSRCQGLGGILPSWPPGTRRLDGRLPAEQAAPSRPCAWPAVAHSTLCAAREHARRDGGASEAYKRRRGGRFSSLSHSTRAGGSLSN